MARRPMKFNVKNSEVNNINYFTSYRQGFLSTILNPKALLYYISVLPQFLSNDGMEIKLQITIISLIVVTVILCWFIFCVYIFSYIKLLFSNTKIKAIFDYCVGLILIGLSFNLLLSKSS